MTNPDPKSILNFNTTVSSKYTTGIANIQERLARARMQQSIVSEITDNREI